MKIFIKDIPVIIISDQDFIKTTSFDKIYQGNKLKFDTELLQGAVLINEASLGIIDSFMVFLKQNQLTELEDITFRVSDYEVVINKLMEEYEIIKAAGGLVFKEGEVLMIWRLKRWDLPKGKLDKGEKPKRAAIREVEEECNVKVKLGKKICHTWHTYKQNDKRILKKTYWYSMYCIDDSDMAPQVEENIEMIKWMDEAEIKAAFYNTYPSIRHVFRHYNLMG